MAFCLLYLLFFIIFTSILYFMTFYPINKLQLSINRLDKENKIFNEINNNFPSSLNTTLFYDKNNVVNSTINLYYDSSSKIVTIITNIGKHVFSLDNDKDVNILLPILLLSK
nr:G3 protein [Wadden Sea poxvirus]